ncbi:aspartyl/asparaginyl beta-hydroxylase (cupin superfamily)/Flp pilus assembly protein TadD [Sphingomonas kaistensis]|uniref:Aspartyl/asparaginyl beta-hydroxylase (Cupin superfamily)/Flp pilus assembly protein TadD n=1 Tax=Sphingomonas kaistensis TaxID=298708 RepID=A0A7X6BGH2_9SPHN|nr:aspartyl/asparaginyl beta-hydroxylase domain-containing protein [Sphingomonas kaistensis]NJC05032.1 aspartyl/asparaginyl beta-hydroxylase (cupin superfamily)/Flp pilus assembly protein TadD [Sphingomonas kaistensis]
MSASASLSDQRLARAMQAQAQGQDAVAARLLSEVLASDPGNPVAHNMLGMAAMARRDPAAAAGHFEQARAAAPDSLPVLANLAGAYRALGRADEEGQVLEAALALDQRHLATLIRLAEWHERRGQTHQATQRWVGVVALSTSVADPSPALAERFAHARGVVAAQTDALSSAIDAALEEQLAAASPQERRRTLAASQAMLGRRPIYTNHCEGMHFPFLPADEWFDREHFPWMEALEAHTATIRDELVALLQSDDDHSRPYVEQAPGTPHNKWSVLDRRNDWSAIHLWREGVRDEVLCAKVPETERLISALPLCRIPGRAPTIFFSLLKAGAHIPAHTGVTNTRAIVHLPLIVPQGCDFRVGGETRPWVEGEAFAFDDTIDHEAWNRSDKDRAVLIFDVWNPHLSAVECKAVTSMFEVADRARSDQP